MKKIEFKANGNSHFQIEVLKEYEGVEMENQMAVNTITDFCQYLAEGQIDKAVKVFFPNL